MKVSFKKDKDAKTSIEIAVTIDADTLIESAQHYHRDANMMVVAATKLRNMVKGSKTVAPIKVANLQAESDKLDWVKIFTPTAKKTLNERMADAYAALDPADQIEHLVATGVELELATSIVSAQHEEAA